MALSFDELKILVCLNRAAGAKAVREAAALLMQGLAPSQVCEALLSRAILTRETLFPDSAVFDPAAEIERAAGLELQLLALSDAGYPFSLKQIADPPLLLYVKGTILPADRAAVAIVGSRDSSFYGLEQAARFGRELAGGGITVVSGLARGIDQAAHQGCLSVAHGRTLAVLGCGADRIYPPENERLFSMIEERGAILSEFPLGMDPLARNFPRRNRVISGLSLGVLVVEAHLRSGSLITARLAAEQGREVYAMPGPVDQWTSRGPHQLLREGAVLAENGTDILSDLRLCLAALASDLQPVSEAPSPAPELSRPPQAALRPAAGMELFSPAPAGREVLACFGKGNSLAADEIIGRVPLAAGEVLAVLAGLEISGEVVKSRDGRYRAS